MKNKNKLQKLREKSPRDKQIKKFCKDFDLLNLQSYYQTMPAEDKDIILTNALFTTVMYKGMSEKEDDDFAMIQWLALLPEVNVHHENEWVFRRLCIYGKLTIAKWFVEHFTIDIHANKEEAFREACAGGHFEMAQWLISIGGVNIHINKEEAFVMSCLYGYLEIAQWLVSLGGVDIHAQNDILFKKETGNNMVLREKERQEVLQWLQDTFITHHDNDDENIEKNA